MSEHKRIRVVFPQGDVWGVRSGKDVRVEDAATGELFEGVTKVEVRFPADGIAETTVTFVDAEIVVGPVCVECAECGDDENAAIHGTVWGPHHFTSTAVESEP